MGKKQDVKKTIKNLKTIKQTIRNLTTIYAEVVMLLTPKDVDESPQPASRLATIKDLLEKAELLLSRKNREERKAVLSRRITGTLIPATRKEMQTQRKVGRKANQLLNNIRNEYRELQAQAHAAAKKQSAQAVIADDALPPAILGESSIPPESFSAHAASPRGQEYVTAPAQQPSPPLNLPQDDYRGTPPPLNFIDADVERPLLFAPPSTKAVVHSVPTEQEAIVECTIDDDFDKTLEELKDFLKNPPATIREEVLSEVQNAVDFMEKLVAATAVASKEETAVCTLFMKKLMALLKNPPTETRLASFEKECKELQGHPSLVLNTLAVLLLAIGAAMTGIFIAASATALVAAVPIVTGILGGLSLFAAGRSKPHLIAKPADNVAKRLREAFQNDTHTASALEPGGNPLSASA